MDFIILLKIIWIDIWNLGSRSLFYLYIRCFCVNTIMVAFACLVGWFLFDCLVVWLVFVISLFWKLDENRYRMSTHLLWIRILSWTHWVGQRTVVSGSSSFLFFSFLCFALLCFALLFLSFLFFSILFSYFCSFFSIKFLFFY